MENMLHMRKTYLEKQNKTKTQNMSTVHDSHGMKHSTDGMIHGILI